MVQRARVRLARRGEGAALSHLQQIYMIRKALSESPWPVRMTNRSRSKPAASFGPAIPAGAESEAEYVDVELTDRIQFSTALSGLAPHLGNGYEAVSVKSIPRYFPSLEELVNLAVYKIAAPELAGTRPHWESFQAKNEFIVMKKKQSGDVPIDARAAVRRWDLNGDELTLEIRVGPGRTLKPEPIIRAVCGWPDESPPSFQVNRIRLSFEKSNGECIDP